MDVIRTLLSLILVIGMMVAGYIWLKRRGNMPGSSDRRMRVIERLPIDARRSILLMEIDGEEIMVGVGGESFTALKTLDSSGQADA